MKVLQKSSPILATFFVLGLFLLPQLVPAEDLTNGVYISVLSSSYSYKAYLSNLQIPGSLLGQVDFAHKFSPQQELRMGLSFSSDSYNSPNSGLITWGLNAEEVMYLGHQFVRPFAGVGVGVTGWLNNSSSQFVTSLYIPGGISLAPTNYLSFGVYSSLAVQEVLYSPLNYDPLSFNRLLIQFTPIQAFVGFWF